MHLHALERSIPGGIPPHLQLKKKQQKNYL